MNPYEEVSPSMARRLIRNGLLIGAAAIFISMFGCPAYNVWHQHMEGRAELAKAEYSKQVAVQEALAKKDAALHLAEAEVARSKGVAKANEIIGQSLSGNEAYLRYLWIQSLGSGSSEVVYIPTEAGLPILEAGRQLGAKEPPK